MTKQEEIREGLSDRIYGLAYQPPDIDKILKWLDSQGVVIEVEREVPKEGLWVPGGWFIPKALCDALMSIATEPLI